ncbi:hypothetical protein ACFLZP_02000 [Patescibacteria group bacterium]
MSKQKKSNQNRLVIFFFLVSFFSGGFLRFALLAPAQAAQGEARLRLNPDTGIIGETPLEIKARIEGVGGEYPIQGVQTSFTFDNSKLELVGYVRNETAFSSPITEPNLAEANDSGQFQVVLTQGGENCLQTPFDLFTLSFKGIENGTEVEINYVDGQQLVTGFYPGNPDTEITVTEAIGGRFTVDTAAEPTASPTGEPTATVAPTAGPTGGAERQGRLVVTPGSGRYEFEGGGETAVFEVKSRLEGGGEPTATIPPGRASLDFLIKFEGIDTWRENQEVKLTFEGNSQVTKTAQVTANADGVFQGSVTDIEPGTFDVSIEGPAHLTKKFTGVVLGEGNTQQNWSDFVLLAGNSQKGDLSTNKVDIYDVALLSEHYEDRKPEAGSPADFNLDGVVNIQDFGFIGANFGLQGD